MGDTVDFNRADPGDRQTAARVVAPLPAERTGSATTTSCSSKDSTTVGDQHRETPAKPKAPSPTPPNMVPTPGWPRRMAAHLRPLGFSTGGVAAVEIMPGLCRASSGADGTDLERVLARIDSNVMHMRHRRLQDWVRFTSTQPGREIRHTVALESIQACSPAGRSQGDVGHRSAHNPAVAVRPLVVCRSPSDSGSARFGEGPTSTTEQQLHHGLVVLRRLLSLQSERDPHIQTVQQDVTQWCLRRPARRGEAIFENRSIL